MMSNLGVAEPALRLLFLTRDKSRYSKFEGRENYEKNQRRSVGFN